MLSSAASRLDSERSSFFSFYLHKVGRTKRRRSRQREERERSWSLSLFFRKRLSASESASERPRIGGRQVSSPLERTLSRRRGGGDYARPAGAVGSSVGRWMPSLSLFLLLAQHCSYKVLGGGEAKTKGRKRRRRGDFSWRESDSLPLLSKSPRVSE